ncbi:Tn3 family transposase [Streptosporangium minutum]|uniref:Tn3 transposase DDE domain-containing protein n=1 Tax=Streptosporangium minutum TaxID=569862 RepID=A0A2C9ZMP0_9ACTN|nr:Tn3 family transposase [Streptosporangium minutum]OUC98675.1 hypothetical protein CA984_05985 [Streptosporangium minutum]
MIEGVLRHCTDATIDRQYTDTHGQNLVDFAFSHLLGFKLLPRMKNVSHQKLVRVDAEQPVPTCLADIVSERTITGGGELFRPCAIPPVWRVAREVW